MTNPLKTLQYGSQGRRGFFRMAAHSLLAGLGLTALASTPANAARCHNPEDPNRSCQEDDDCCGSSVCCANASNHLNCCYPTGAVTSRADYCCSGKIQVADGVAVCL
ncbi:hypothetical protein Ntsu_57190 [Nocardia sp. IFM 10818]